MNMTNIATDSNLEKIAIVVVGYNRLKSIQRLISSLLLADYKGDNVPLVISIDYSGDEKLYEYVKQVEWPFGEKYVNIQEVRLGLKQHIYQCGDLTQYFKAIILLEDDLFVSPYFYNYVRQTLNKYGENEQIAQISLYKNETNGYASFPFLNLQTGSDVFLMQDVSTWGECWNHKMWTKFKHWRDSVCTDELIQSAQMPYQIKQWGRAWSKYYNAYVSSKDLFCIYPNVSLTTNFSDAGEHGSDNTSAVQNSLLYYNSELRLPEVKELPSYDGFFNNLLLYSYLQLTPEECLLDIYGIREYNNLSQKYILTTRKLNLELIKSYGLCMRPIEENVRYQIPGDGIRLYKINSKEFGIGEYLPNFIDYHLRHMNMRELTKYVFRHYLEALKRRLKIRNAKK